MWLFKRLLPLLFTTGFCANVVSQVRVCGTVTDSVQRPVIHSQVILFSVTSGQILTYSFTDSNGHYCLQTHNPDKYKIEFHGLGYVTETRFLEIPKNPAPDSVIKIDVRLKSKVYEIDEVIKQGERPISIKKDTITYNVLAFSNGTEKVVEDILKKLPGINVDDDGKINFKGKEVEKVMIEGDDFFGKGYRVLTQNVHANAIEKVEAISNYSDNPLLKQIANSEKVALNLKLNKNAHSKIYGNADLGYNTINNHYVNTNLMNFSSTVRSLFIGNSNSIGFKPIGDPFGLMQSLSESEKLSEYDIDLPKFILDIQEQKPQFKRQKVSTEENHMGSLNEAITISTKSKLTITSAFNQIHENFNRNTSQNYSYDTIMFTNIDNYKLDKSDRRIYVKAKLENFSNQNTFIQLNTNFSGVYGIKNANTNFNGNEIQEKIPDRSALFNGNFAFTKKIGNRSVVQVIGYGYTGTFKEFFSVSPIPKSIQFPDWKNYLRGYQYFSRTANMAMGLITYKYRLSDFVLFETETGANAVTEKLNATFKLTDSSNIVHGENALSGNTNYKLGRSFLKIDLTLGSDSIKLKFGITGNLMNYREPYRGIWSSKAVIQPTARFSWGINKINKVSLSYNSTNSAIPFYHTINHYYLSSHNSITKGLGQFDYIGKQTFTLNYSLGNWSTRLFFNSMLLYYFQPKSIAQNMLIDQFLICKSDTLGEDNRYIMVNSEINYFVKALRTNIKLTHNSSYQSYTSFFNGKANRTKSNSMRNGIELRSAFQSFFNFHLGYSYSQSYIFGKNNKNINYQRVFFNMYIKANQRVNAEILSELYGNYNSKLSLNGKSYLFVDATLTYKFKESGWSISLTGYNLFNRKIYYMPQIAEYEKMITFYNLIPRYLLGTVSFKF